MRKTGIVRKAGSVCEVSIVRKSACGENCASCKGGCLPNDTTITAQNIINADVGERVILEIPDKTAVVATTLVYLLPIAVLIVGMLVAYVSGLTEGQIILVSVVAMLVSIFAVVAVCRKFSDRFRARVTELAEKSENIVG